MSTATILDREEYIEQAYLFRTVRERIADNQPAQDVFLRVGEELLSSTRLPFAVQFVASELKHTGLVANGFAKLPHYFTAFQAFVVRQAENEKSRLPMPTAFLILEREAAYRAEKPTKAGLFVYQFETISRNRLGYLDGLEALALDPFYDANWRDYFDDLRKQVGEIDFCDLVYLRSDLYVIEERRRNPAFEPPLTPIFGEKEGKIAKASRTRDPLYLFAALQRQLGYPEVPRYRIRDDATTKLEQIQTKLRELEMRIKLAESELRGSVDLSQFGKPELLKDDDE
ncbi:Uncharacterized protein OS=Singulisphaera acidiphila (strain ATCC BAA-1392 / DSM 18658 / VKM B-2454 / MOB10) GN=Sinac_3289 PE=4 SV=1 [Gemmata massiliana]|uniref:Uncharacterized protein n=1 Tax=Gemmata massiliana TaxID=1210884 RepID=A0A6P2CUU1_9BACT|nr:hypothetical protein [Gemmata massiliana]VTR90872.1 Uncharacterized protein OS=Singulisphaera acidiphila (strain ATCC BAA-1392 / DSM 18658 / VKM B-2454 / MOB10) GN=Sinac_3289 PE=4 SV=1 [Gemmata massiliana]